MGRFATLPNELRNSTRLKMYYCYIKDTSGTVHVIPAEANTHQEACEWLVNQQGMFDENGDFVLILREHIVSVVIKEYEDA